MEQRGLRARIYARVSTAEQALEGYSIEAQLTECRRWIESHQHKYTGEYIDAGRSGKNTDRPQLQEALADAVNGEYDILVVHKLDRLSRSLFDTLAILKTLHEHNVTLVSATEQFDFTTPIGRMYLGLLALLAQWFLDNLSQEIRKGNRQKVEQGEWHGRVPPPGYRLVNKLLVVHSREAAMVRTLFKLYSTGNYTLPELQRILHAHHLGMWSVGKRKNEPEAYHPVRLFMLSRILRNQTYCGDVVYVGEEQRRLAPVLRTPIVRPGKHTALVDRETWQRCQEMLDRQHRGGRGAHVTSRKYIFGSGLLRCSHCGGIMQSRTADDMAYYGCFARYTDHKCDAPMTWINERLLLDQLEQLLEKLKLPDEWEQNVSAMYASPQQIDANAHKREELEARRRRIKSLFINGRMEEAEYYAADNKLIKEIDGLPSSTISQKQVLDAGRLLVELPKVWTRASTEQKRSLLRMMVSEIWVDALTKQMTRFKASPSFTVMFESAGLERDGEFLVMPPAEVTGSVRVWKGKPFDIHGTYTTKEEADEAKHQLHLDGYAAQAHYVGKRGVRMPDGHFERNCWAVWKRKAERPDLLIQNRLHIDPRKARLGWRKVR